MSTDIAATLPVLTVAAETDFTVARLREFVTTTLSDSALQVFLDSALDAIDDVRGPATVTKWITAGRGPLLMLSQEAESIAAIAEDSLALAADDYELSDSGRLLYRLHDGTNPRRYWRGRVEVTYVQPQGAAQRIRVAVALVNLDLSFRPGLVSEEIDTWKETYQTKASGKSYAEQRAEILASLTDEIGAVL